MKRMLSRKMIFITVTKIFYMTPRGIMKYIDEKGTFRRTLLMSCCFFPIDYALSAKGLFGKKILSFYPNWRGKKTHIWKSSILCGFFFLVVVVVVVFSFLSMQLETTTKKLTTCDKEMFEAGIINQRQFITFLPITFSVKSKSTP